MRVRGLSWVGVGADDYPAALAFFTEVLGLRVAVSDPRGVAMLHVGEGQVLEIFGPSTKGRQNTSPPVVAFEVDDVTSATAELLDRGVELVGETGRWNGFEWQYFRGPDGHFFALKTTPAAGWESTA